MTNTHWRRSMILLFMLALLSAATAWAAAPRGPDGALDIGDARSGTNHGGGGIDSSNGDPCRLFGDATEYPTGDYPYSVAVGDFDGDGVHDLAVTNGWSDDLSVLLGLGDGSFAVEQRFGVGDYPNQVAVGDFDGDGAQDLVVGNWFSADVSVLLGLGDGGFAEHRLYESGGSPRSVAVGSFNKNDDDIPDIVVGLGQDNEVHIMRGLGDGSFAADRAYRYGVGEYPLSVAVGDFDNDGNPDVAVANHYSFPGDISVLLGWGWYWFYEEQRYGAGNGQASLAVGDFDGDGAQDLAVANSLSDDLSVLLGLGNGTFAAEQRFSAGSFPFSVAVGDFDDDGAQDLAVANWTGDISVLVGLGDGTFSTEQRYETGVAHVSVAVGDFDGDGAQDLVVTNTYEDTVSVLLNQCATLGVEIDIKPDSSSNSVNPRSHGVIPVAVFGNDSFHVADIDEETLGFGPGVAPIVHRQAHYEDVNHDGVIDLMLHFRTRDTRIACGDESVTLTGETLDGRPIEGTDSIQTVGCREARRPAIWMKDQGRPETAGPDRPVNIERK